MKVGNDYPNKALQLRNLWSRNASCAGLDQNLEYAYSLELNPLFTNPQPDGERYFYHSDHLGSSAYITTENGYATQFLAYMPYGETLSEQQNSTNYYSPFKFSAKEKDPETGYSYFGARYYSPELSVWLSIDPLADKAPGWTPYRYGFNNPIRFIDPTGMIETDPDNDPPKKLDITPKCPSPYPNQPTPAPSPPEQIPPYAQGQGPNAELKGEGTENKIDLKSSTNNLAQKKSEYDVQKAINFLNKNAHEDYRSAKGQCAKFVRMALNCGGLRTPNNPFAARQYSTYLPTLGFSEVQTSTFLPGDIAVIQGYQGGSADRQGIPYGHIQMYNGQQWISDFKQRDFWPGGGYRRSQPAYQIFRFNTNPL